MENHGIVFLNFCGTPDFMVSLFLALQYTNGTSILNGKRSLSHTGNYPAAGTVFRYNRFSGTNCPGECLFANGPLTLPLDLKVPVYTR